ncbi:hypothetical protein [Nocardia sp. NPDC056000]|uniref:hypothetical protein n=1 Tax=Nocardia sp. NPDC056000 TaxID=3345674 RepID=UPI0035E25939
MSQEQDPRFAELSSHPVYPEIRGVVASYIHASIANPAATQPEQWNVSALPTTEKAKGRRRLLTLNCGGLETLYVTELQQEGGIAVEITINIDAPDGWSDERLALEAAGVWTRCPDYRTARVWSWNLDLAALLEDDIDFDALLQDQDFDYLAAQLTGTLMRRQSPYTRYHCAALANDLLAEVEEIRREEADEQTPAS